MTEFKIANGLSDEVTSLQNSGNNLTININKIASDKISTLKTSMQYIEQQESIQTLLNLYKNLLSKDVADLFAMIDEVKAMDESIASSNK